MAKNVSVKFKYDMKDFEEKAKNVIKDVREESLDTIKYCGQVFANAAARYTPPNIGKNTIEKSLYDRPYLILLRLIRGGYRRFNVTDEDKNQFANGMIYKVLGTKNGKLTTFGYCKTKTQLRKMTRIANRGLSRVMWGKNLNEIGVKVPPSILRLIKKSPNLDKLQYNSNTLINEGDTVGIEIENKAVGIEKIGKGAEQKGYEKVKSGLNWKLKLIAERQRNI